ncbi:MAG: hypothetical protein ACRDK0_01385 [Solirubrobacteraceae bacterium]
MTMKLISAFMAVCAGGFAALAAFLYLTSGRPGFALLWFCIAGAWLLIIAPMWIRMHLRERRGGGR